MATTATPGKPKNGAQLFDVMYECRSMRRLKPDSVPEEVLLQLVDAAIHAPSSSNGQNWQPYGRRAPR